MCCFQFSQHWTKALLEFSRLATWITSTSLNMASMPLKLGSSACPSAWTLPQKHKYKKLSLEVSKPAGKTREEIHKITSVISVEVNECLILCHVLFCSGLDGSMNIFQSFPAARPFLIVAKTRRDWWHGEPRSHESLMCFALMNQVWFHTTH